MIKFRIITALVFAVILMSCNSEKSNKNKKSDALDSTENGINLEAERLKSIKTELPTIGVLMYNGILQSEVVAVFDVFSKPSEDGKQLFNVVAISESENPISTEEGMRFIPDFTFKNAPKLTALFVPSANDMSTQIHNKKIVSFIKDKNREAKYMVSNCAGAQLIGVSGIADGKKIVTWIGGGKQLQIDYPTLKVQDDSLVTFVEDGKFSSSNGNLATYISALNLAEKMTSPEHRKFVESYIYLDRLQNWKN